LIVLNCSLDEGRSLHINIQAAQYYKENHLYHPQEADNLTDIFVLTWRIVWVG